jgi:hypothetical protein
VEDPAVKQHTDVEEKAEVGRRVGCPLCSSSGGARVMTRLFTVVQTSRTVVGERCGPIQADVVSKPLRSDSLSNPASAGDG